jgi:adenylate cyclase
MERVQLYARIREETRIRAQLERFFSPQVVELILKESQLSPDLLLPPRRVEGTFLFADIQGFSLLAERLEPGEVAELLRDYFTVMTEVIFEHQGTVDKYIGDCLLAVFGVPFPYEDHPERAVTCALEILARHREFVTARDERKRFHIRVGINTGEADAGYIGSPRRLEYTVLGEAVIVAERLQSFAEPDQIYIGRRTYERIRGRFPVTFLGRFAPKGGKEIEVYRVEVERVGGIKG